MIKLTSDERSWVREFKAHGYSERELMEIFLTSRHEIRKALVEPSDSLVDEPSKLVDPKSASTNAIGNFRRVAWWAMLIVAAAIVGISWFYGVK